MQLSVAELPRCLDQCTPRGLVALVDRAYVPRELKCVQCTEGGRAERARLGTDGGGVPGGSEAALQVANGLALLTGSQREAGRNSESSWSS
jgi:hypothetical protein